MPVCVKRIKDLYRVVECTTQTISKNKAGTAVDGGGHKTKQAAIKQVNAINISLRKLK